MPIPKPKPYERMDEFMQRCMSDDKMVKEYETGQRIAVCRSAFEEKLASEKISFDFDGVLTTERGYQLAESYVMKGAIVYIVSARPEKNGMLHKAKRLGIPESRVFATRSNKRKIETINSLQVDRHYDNNQEVIDALGKIGYLFR